MNKGKYYITTAIAYTSGKPHIGNSYEIVLADSIARFKRKDGYDVYFRMSTDRRLSSKPARKALPPENLWIRWREPSKSCGT